MLDQVSAVAFEMQSSKGVFALLLGSGVSYTSKIPTGWAITLDLVRQVAELHGEECGEKPEIWYRGKFGKEPDYSDLLDTLGSTQALRQDIIRKYIEPTEAERERGDKQPTPAHRAIANLMAKGYLRVVLTTNFDRLLEQALADVGAQPTVISSAAHVVGAKPLVHAGPTIIKLHGDYLDARIRNTSHELASYEPEINQLLDRVFDEFGLIVCGWSAEWDLALREAIDRAPARRYPMYWASYGAPTAAAEGLINRRAGRVVNISGADGFFDELAQKVHAIESMRKPHPATVDLAVALLKEYLPEPRHRIRLHDLISNEVARAAAGMESSKFSTRREDDTALAEQIDSYISLLATLIPMAYIAGIWCTEEQTQQWVKSIVVFVNRMRNTGGGYTHLIHLRSFPATLLMYAFGLGAVVGNQHSNLGKIVGKGHDFGRAYGGHMTLGDRLNITMLIDGNGQRWCKTVPKYKDRSYPGSDLIADLLRPVATLELPDSAAFDAAFAKLELALTFGFAERQGADHSNWAPTGRYAYQPEIVHSVLRDWEADVLAKKHNADLRLMAALNNDPDFGLVRRLLG